MSAHGGVRLRVLYLTWRDLDHPEAGGAEVFAERMAEELSRRGHHVQMFSSAVRDEPSDVRRAGFGIRRRGRRYTVYVRAALHLLRHRRDYDAVVDVQNGVPFWAPLFFRGPVLNLTHHVHREQWRTFFPAPVAVLGWFLESRVAVRVYRRSHYVTVSQASRDELVRLGIATDRISVIYSGIDPPPDLAELDALPDSPEPSVVVVGRLVSHKRVEIAMDALAALASPLPTLHLHVVGDGYWSDRLEQHAAALGISERVTFHGFVSDEEKHRILARAWVLAMPSVKEGWGLAIIEAGLHRTPAVAYSSAGGTRESIIDNETGLLAIDTEDFVDGLHRLLTDDDFRIKLGDNARARALTLDWRNSGEGLHALLVRETERSQPS